MYHPTLFSDLVKPIDRGVFAGLVKRRGSDRYAKSFKSWQHLMGMLYCQFSGAASLREAEATYAARGGVSYHLHLPCLKRSTLSQANNARGPELFRDVAVELLAQCRHRAEVDCVLQLIDSSPIVVSGRGNQWTKQTRSSRINGLKLHLAYEPQGGALEYADITPANVNDITAIAAMPLEAGKVYVFDKGYCDYNWWKAIADCGSVFVTRLKKNAACKVIGAHPIAEEDKGFILKDEAIALTNRAPRGSKTNELANIPLRRIAVAREGAQPLVIVTNALEKAPAVIAGYYKKRWQIELLFKWLKRYLKVKTFLGESQNSIKIQLYSAIIAYLLLWLYRRVSHTASYSLTQLRIITQTLLLTRPQTQRCRIKQQQINLLNETQLQMAL